MIGRALTTAVCAAALASAIVPATAGTAARRPCSASPSSHWLSGWTRSYAARLTRPAQVYRTPGGRPFARLGRTDRYGFPTTVSLVERRTICGIRWYRARIAVWPNETTGWIRSRAVHVTPLRSRIVVDLSRHELLLFRRGHVVFRSPAAVGASSTPTPRGSFFVTQRFVVRPATGPYGPRAIGISAFSETLRTWRDGGPVAIHGTNEPFSVGRPVSHGCVRLPNDAVVRLFARTPLGTPVTIRR